MRFVAPVLALTASALLMAMFARDLRDPRIRIAFIATAALEGLLVLPLRERIARVVLAVGKPGHDLALLAQVLKRLEAEQFSSPKLSGTARAAGRGRTTCVSKDRRLAASDGIAGLAR